MTDLDSLRQYYETCFPCNQIYDWLSYSVKDTSKLQNNNSKDAKIFNSFHLREFSFEIGEAYSRFNSFVSADGFKQMITRENGIPSRFEIGAAYNMRPSKTDKDITPIFRELVFDIDINDYNEVRTCCDDSNHCLKCWKFVTIGMKFVDKTLKEDFGFKNIIWFFSGGRGVHCWVNDPAYLNLDNNERALIVKYLSDFKFSLSNKNYLNTSEDREKFKSITNQYKDIISSNNNYLIELVEYFEEDFYNFIEQIPILNLINTIPEDAKKIYEFFDKNKNNPDTELLYYTFKKELKNIKFDNINNLNSLQAWKCNLILSLCHPRLDQNVSIGMNHLLKSPFCIHPRTKNVCIPIINFDKFDPSDVPKLNDVLNNPSLLDKYLQYFDKYLKQLNHDVFNYYNELFLKIKEEKPDIIP